MFGISSAPEVYQHVIQLALSDCEGVANISDDIIVHGKTTKEHDERLKRVLEKLKEKNLTLNAEKCKFHMTKLVFMGLMLTTKGTGPTEEKVCQKLGVSWDLLTTMHGFSQIFWY